MINTLRFAAFLAAFACVLAGSVVTVASSPSGTASDITLEVGGTSQVAREGNVINLGVMKTNGYCNIPEITVANHPDLQKYSSGSTTVDLVLQDDCSLKVAGIDTSGASPMSSPDTLGVHIKGWAKAELNDFAGIDLAATYTEMQWYDYGSYVDEGSDLVDWCHWFSTSGWRNDSCDAYWWPYGSDYVYSQTIGAFHNVNCLGDGCARTLESQVHAEPAYQITLSCSQSPNQSPPGTHFLCNSDWTTVN